MYNIEKSPQYDLYRLTKKLNLNEEKLVVKKCRFPMCKKHNY